jgi:hypothetical protein
MDSLCPKSACMQLYPPPARAFTVQCGQIDECSTAQCTLQPAADPCWVDARQQRGTRPNYLNLPRGRALVWHVTCGHRSTHTPPNPRQPLSLSAKGKQGTVWSSAISQKEGESSCLVQCHTYTVLVTCVITASSQQQLLTVQAVGKVAALPAEPWYWPALIGW